MILIVTQNFLPDPGGIQRYVSDLADALNRRGHRVEVVCRTADGAKAFDDTRHYPVHRFGGPRLWRQFLTRQAVVARLKRGDVTTIVTDTWKSLEPLPAKALKAVRVVSLAHGNEFLAKDAHREQRIREAVAKADVVAANSRFTARLAAGFGAAAEVVLPGISAPAPAAAPLTVQGRHILTIARLEPRKGVDSVIRALPQIRAIVPDLVYDIAGSGADRPRLEALANDLGVADGVRFHGRVTDAQMAELLSAADVFVLPNRREGVSVEGFGLVFLEAAAVGVPAIAGSDGGAGDAVLDGQTGLVVDGTSQAAVSAALEKLLSDDDLRLRMAKAAQSRFYAEFAWDAAIVRFEKVMGL